MSVRETALRTGAPCQLLGALLGAHVAHAHVSLPLAPLLLAHVVSDPPCLVVLFAPGVVASASAVAPIPREGCAHGSTPLGRGLGGDARGDDAAALLPGALGEHAEMLFLARLLLLRQLLLHERALADFLAGMAVGDEERLGELCKVVVDVYLRGG